VSAPRRDAGAGLANPPGRRALDYRVGTYETFVPQMLDRLVMNLEVEASGFAGAAPGTGAALGAVAAPAGRHHLVRFNLDEADNWLIALTRSWATVADVLTFYQERLVQEGYLRTAVEERSVHELAGMVAYQPRPGVAGRTWLAIDVSTLKGLPSALDLPARLVVRSVPPPGAEPQAFETTEPLRAEAAWNVLTPRPFPKEVPPQVVAGATSLRLAGTGTGLAPGAWLLVTAVDAGGRPLRRLRRVTAVEARPGAAPYTEVSWQEPLAPEPGGARLSAVQAFALRRQAGLFGRNAPPWSELPADARREVQGLAGGVLVFDGAAWRSRNEGLPSATAVVSLAADRRGTLYAGTREQGVFRSLDAGATWEPARRGLQQLDVRALAVDPRGIVYAGTSTGAVFRSTDRGAIWEPASGQAVGAAPPSRLPWRRGAAGGPLPPAAVHALLAVRWDDVSAVLAATGAGVQRSTDGGRTWRPASRGMPGAEEGGATDLAVEALAAGPGKREVWAGTARGVFRTADGADRWQPKNRGLPSTDPFTGFSATAVHALALIAPRGRGEPRLVAGTERGVFVSTDGGEHWRPRPLPPPTGSPPSEPPAVGTLALAEDPLTLDRRLFAGTPRGLWTSSDEGESWQPVEPFPPGPVAAVAAASGGGAAALAATPFGGFSDDWPGFWIHGGDVDLDSLVDGVLPGSWLALVPGGTAASGAAGIYRVRAAGAVRRRDFGLDAMVTRLEVDPDDRLARFSLRDTRAWLDSRELPLARRVEEHHGIALEVLRVTLGGLDPLRRVLVTGQRPAESYAAAFVPGELNAPLAEVARALALRPPDLAATARVWSRQPTAGEDPDSELRMPLRDMVRVLRVLTDPDAPPDALAMAADGAVPGEGAGPAPEMVAAMRSLRRLVVGGVTAGIWLAIELPRRTDGAATTAAELAAVLGAPIASDDVDSGVAVRLPAAGGQPGPLVDAATLRVYGNVVAAVEGTTVAGEVLGDGDATRANQAFTLARPPSFHLGGDPGGSAGGLTSTVRVEVQGQRWEPRAELWAAGPQERVYRLDVDQDGRATVVFGNGERGARLPSGRDNVVASYGSGMSTRAVPAGGVSLLQNRPLGLDAVSNPLVTTPGAGAEPPDEVRRRAPRSVRTLDRVVTLSDFADFARGFPGVAKAGAWSLVAAGRPLVQVTVATPGGAPMDDGGGLLRDLRDAIDHRRATDAPLSLLDHAAVAVRLAAGLVIDPAFEWERVEQEVRRRLADRFGFERAAFGGAVPVSAVVRTMQGARGVVAVDLDELSDGRVTAGTRGDPSLRELAARPPRVEAGRVRPAELLVLGEVELRRVEAP
jgi:hypothetical protein